MTSLVVAPLVFAVVVALLAPVVWRSWVGADPEPKPTPSQAAPVVPDTERPIAADMVLRHRALFHAGLSSNNKYVRADLIRVAGLKVDGSLVDREALIAVLREHQCSVYEDR